MRKWLWPLLLQVYLSANQDLWDAYKIETITPVEQRHIPGWCSREKAEKMMDLIYHIKPKICVEIGVYGGSSLFPTAKALKYLSEGIVYAIDPWSEEECIKGYLPDDVNYKWWKNESNLDFMFNQFMQIIKKYSLGDYCSIYPMDSKRAVQYFTDESIDILHVDGNHTEQSALSDVTLYLPKVKKGGYIWFDDVNWDSTKAAQQYLNRHCTHDRERSTETCYLYQKN